MKIYTKWRNSDDFFPVNQTLILVEGTKFFARLLVHFLVTIKRLGFSRKNFSFYGQGEKTQINYPLRNESKKQGGNFNFSPRKKSEDQTQLMIDKKSNKIFEWWIRWKGEKILPERESLRKTIFSLLICWYLEKRVGEMSWRGSAVRADATTASETEDVLLIFLSVFVAGAGGEESFLF